MFQSLDIRSSSLAPRMEWTYDSENFEFSYTVPRSDIDAAVPLKRDERPIDLFQHKPGSRDYSTCLANVSLENAAGKIWPEETDTSVVLRFQPRVLPPFDLVDESLTFLEKQAQRNATRRPHIQALGELYSKLSELSLTQLQFGIPPKKFDLSTPLPGARIAFMPGLGRLRPYVVVTEGFHAAHNAELEENSGSKVTQIAKDYIKRFDPESVGSQMVNELTMLPDVLLHLPIGCTCFGLRGPRIDTTDKPEATMMRYQVGDSYEASIHNLGPDYFQEAVMAIVGTMNRITRERQLNLVPAQL